MSNVEMSVSFPRLVSKEEKKNIGTFSQIYHKPDIKLIDLDLLFSDFK
jgi:hypothetical protein